MVFHVGRTKLERPSLFMVLGVLAFFSSFPINLPCLDAFYMILNSTSVEPFSSITEDTTFIRAMLIAIMFTALALLFVCLIKTSFKVLKISLVRVGAAAYLFAYLFLVVATWHGECPPELVVMACLPLGFGSTILFSTWLSYLRSTTIKSSLIALIIILSVSTVISVGVLLLPPGLGMTILFFLACAGTFYAINMSQKNSAYNNEENADDSNWWDVFGKFDISLIKGADNYRMPSARIIFFIATPLTVLLLLVANRNLSANLPDPFTTIITGTLVAIPFSLPLLFIKSDKGLMNTAYSLYLPLFAFGVFVANSFELQTSSTIVMSVGINAFCIIYFLLVAAIIITMSGIMRSLSIPASSILLIGFSLIALLSFTNVDADFLRAYQNYLLMGLFVIAVAFLLATPGSQMLRLILHGMSQSSESESVALFYMRRCEEISEEYGLTQRESDILTLLGRGHSASHVAEELVIAESTARSHRRNIYRKLSINSREELLVLFDGLTDEE